MTIKQLPQIWQMKTFLLNASNFWTDYNSNGVGKDVSLPLHASSRCDHYIYEKISEQKIYDETDDIFINTGKTKTRFPGFSYDNMRTNIY